MGSSPHFHFNVAFSWIRNPSFIEEVNSLNKFGLIRNMLMK